MKDLTAPPDGDAVRIVIWDLDECFWRGTADEAAIRPVPEHIAIVKALIQQGIISSICSCSDQRVRCRWSTHTARVYQSVALLGG